MNKNLLSETLSFRAAYLNSVVELGKNVPAIIRGIRVKKNWTQKELAEYLKVNSTYISHLESGRKFPSWRVVAELLKLSE